MRADFNLPESDLEFLNSLTGLRWETVSEAGVNRVVIYDYPVCKGYNEDKVDLYFRIISTYPDSQIDMVYFHPHLSLSSGGTIRALAIEKFDGKNWQRWSRHRTNKNPWRPGIDGIETQLALVNHWLEREVRK